MTDTTQHDPRARAQASLTEHFNKMQSVFSECVIKPQIDYQNGYITGYLALDEELTRLREQFVAQQARIVSLKSAMFRVDMKLSGDGDELGCGEVLREYLDTPDDLSALKAHDDALIEKCANFVAGIPPSIIPLTTKQIADHLRSLKR